MQRGKTCVLEETLIWKNNKESTETYRDIYTRRRLPHRAKREETQQGRGYVRHEITPTNKNPLRLGSTTNRQESGTLSRCLVGCRMPLTDTLLTDGRHKWDTCMIQQRHVPARHHFQSPVTQRFRSFITDVYLSHSASYGTSDACIRWKYSHECRPQSLSQSTKHWRT